MRDKGSSLDGQADHRTVGSDALVVLLPGEKLVAIVGEVVATEDAQIAGLQFRHQLGEYAHLKMTTTQTLGGTQLSFAIALLRDQPPPGFRHPGKIQMSILRYGQPFASFGLVFQEKAQRLFECSYPG